MSVSNLLERTNEPRNDREEAAFAYADRGWNVLPLQPRSKKPFKGNGVTHATTDKTTIRSWFSDNADINIGIAAGNGLVVLDADSTEAAEALSSFPPTLTASTGRGKHFYYAATRPYENSVSAVFNKVDVRSFGGYVVAPPSVHANGATYQWENPDVSIASLPPEIERRLEPDNNARTLIEPDVHEMIVRDQKPESENHAPTSVDPDLHETIIREGQRNDWLAKTAGSVVRWCVDSGFTEADARTLLHAKNERQCSPPLDRPDVDAIAKSIYAAEMRKTRKSKLRLLSRSDVDNLPEPEFLIDRILVKNSLAILYGAPGAAKTFLALSFAISVASGTAWFGRKVVSAPVVYVCAEGHSGIGRRINAAELHNKVAASNLYVIDEGIQLHQPKEIDGFIALLHSANVRPSLVVFDTLARCAVGVDENAAKDMGEVIAGLERVKREFGATVLVVHHSTKADTKTIRGSSSISGAVDTALAMVTNKKGERVLTVEKQKDAEEGGPLTFALQSVPEFNSAVPMLVGNTATAPSLTENDETALTALAKLGTAEYTKWRQATDLKKATFDRSRTRLTKAGLIQKSSEGIYGLTAQPS